jgi:hypothetical protein
MASYQGKDTYGNRAYIDSGVIRKLGSVWERISLRVSNSWSSFVRHIYSTVRRSPFVTPEREESLRKWAFRNALTLTFLSTMFLITWGFLTVIIWRQ